MRTLARALLFASLSCLGSLLPCPVEAGPKLADMLPMGPLLTDAERAAYDAPVPSGAAYAGEATLPYPALPLQIFGLQYGVDIVLVSNHPDWDMHEYARIDLPGRPSVWVAKDASAERVQTIVSDLPDLLSWVPEAPITRLPRPLAVEDRSSGDRIDVRFAYTNSAGDPVRVSYRGKMARRPPGKRNGATMGHSRDLGAIVLDLRRFRHGGKARVEIGGERYRLERLLGFYPQKYLLSQVQGGVVIARFVQRPGEGGFTLLRPGDDQPWPTAAAERWTVSAPDADGVVLASHDNGITTLRYRFRDGELLSADALQAGVEAPVFRLALDRALPDLRRPFDGTVESRFVMDIGDQRAHGVGVIRARWEDGAAVVEIVPTAHADLATRPLESTVRLEEDGSVRVETVRR